MLFAVAGSSAGTLSSVGTASGLPSAWGFTGSVKLSVTDVSVFRSVLSGIDAPFGSLAETASVGRLVSIRTEVDVAEESDGSSAWSAGATATNTTLFRPSGRLAGAVIVNWPDEFVIA